MELLVLGSGTGFPRPDRSAAAYLVKVGRKRLAVDLGPGTLRRLGEEGIDFQSLDALLITHLHPDHTLDLWAYVFATLLPGFVRRAKVVLVGPGGLAVLAERLKQAYGEWMDPRPETFQTVLLNPFETNSFGLFPGFEAGLAVTAGPANHNAQALAYRLQAGGKSLVFSGDTDLSEDLIRLSQGADLLVLDCAAPEGAKIKGHLMPSEAGRLARQAKVKRLLLTHFYPETERRDILGPARAAFGGPVKLAQDGMRIRV